MTRMPERKMRVLIVDDHDIVRSGLVGILSGIESVEICGEAADGESALRMVEKMKPDLVLLDISLPDISGLEVLKRLAKDGFPRVLILSMHTERPYVVRALQGGAYGYVSKQNVSEELPEAIEKIAGGGKYLSQSLMESMPFSLHKLEAAPHDGLSEHEAH